MDDDRPIEWLDVADRLITALETRWSPPSIPNDEWYYCIPLPFRQFATGIEIVFAQTEGRRFLDLGCGIGRAMLAAKLLGCDVRGIERHEPYAEVARLLTGAPVISGDVRDAVDLEADIVFMYRLARDLQVEQALEEAVVSRLTPGTVLWLPTRDESSAPLDARPVTPEVWVI